MPPTSRRSDPTFSKDVEPAARAVARRWRADVLGLPDGAALGSEAALLARYGCSRPTLRQAARLLEHQQLLVVRRGPGGGYYGRRPRLDSVVEAMTLHLQLRGTSWPDLLAASEDARPQAMRMAALSTDEATREALEGVVARLARLSEEEGAPSDDDLLLHDCLMRLVGNAPLEMFLRTLFAFGLKDTRERARTGPERWALWRQSLLAIAAGVLARDAAAADRAARSHNALLLSWVETDMLDPTLFPKIETT